MIIRLSWTIALDLTWLDWMVFLQKIIASVLLRLIFFERVWMVNICDIFYALKLEMTRSKCFPWRTTCFRLGTANVSLQQFELYSIICVRWKWPKIFIFCLNTFSLIMPASILVPFMLSFLKPESKFFLRDRHNHLIVFDACFRLDMTLLDRSVFFEK